jgi:hypothetical protein
MTDTSEVATVPAANAKGAPTAPTAPASPAESELPASFEIALQKMLRAFGDGRDPSLSAIAGAALVLLQKAEQSLATIAAADKTKSGVVMKQEGDLAGLHTQLNALEVANQASQAETKTSMTRLDENLDDLRVRHNELFEKVNKLEAGQRDQTKYTEDLADLVHRIELLETRRHRPP